VTINDLHRLLIAMGFPVDRLNEDVPLGYGGIGLDSLASLELYLRIEEDFGVVLDESIFSTLPEMTVGDLLAEVTR
jgi:acyl carrier protein